MRVPRIKIVNVSRRDLPEELVDDIIRGSRFGVISDTADMYNLRVATYEVEFDRENTQKCVTYTIGDTQGVAE